MDLVVDDVSFTDLHDGNDLNRSTLELLFGYNLDWNWIYNLKIAPLVDNFCILGPRNNCTSIASIVYSVLNGDFGMDSWMGWCHIWSLKVMPRIKIFMWKLAQGKLVIGSYLYHINIGPYT